VKWLWKCVCFFCWLPIALFFLALECASNFLMQLTGGAPQSQNLAVIRYRWKDLWGIKEVKMEFDCVNGYLYQKVTFSDGSQLLFRD